MFLQAYKDLPRPLYVISAATVVNSMGMFVFPFAALFLITYQKMDPLQSGLIITIIGLAIGLGTALLGFFLPESKPSEEELEHSHQEGGLDKAHKGSLIGALLSRPHLLIYTIFGFLLTFVYAEHRFGMVYPGLVYRSPMVSTRSFCHVRRSGGFPHGYLG